MSVTRFVPVSSPLACIERHQELGSTLFAQRQGFLEELKQQAETLQLALDEEVSRYQTFVLKEQEQRDHLQAQVSSLASQRDSLTQEIKDIRAQETTDRTKLAALEKLYAESIAITGLAAQLLPKDTYGPTLK